MGSNRPGATRTMGSGIPTASWTRSLTRAKELERLSISQTIMEHMDLPPSTTHTLTLDTIPTVDMFQRRTLLTAISICHHNMSPNIKNEKRSFLRDDEGFSIKNQTLYTSANETSPIRILKLSSIYNYPPSSRFALHFLSFDLELKNLIIPG